jgi:hypothetical protein
VGFFPYINIPTRYIFATIQIKKKIVIISKITDPHTSRRGGEDIFTRVNIRIGVKNGIIEKTTEVILSGFFTTKDIIVIGIINRITTGKEACCAS